MILFWVKHGHDNFSVGVSLHIILPFETSLFYSYVLHSTMAFSEDDSILSEAPIISPAYLLLQQRLPPSPSSLT